MMLVKLPNGLLDGPDLFNVVEIDELRGKQQNYLVDRELVFGNIGHIPKILEDMILSLQTKEGREWKGKVSDAIWKLPSGDLSTILIKIRENTYGPKLYMEAQCSHCEELNKNIRLDLDKLKLDALTAKDRTKKPVLNIKDGTEVELKPLYLDDLFKSIEISKKQSSTLVTSTLAVSIKRIGEKVGITHEDIDALTMKDIMLINEKAEKIKIEGSIDTEVTTKCEHCGKDFDHELNPFVADFFVPSKGSTT